MLPVGAGAATGPLNAITDVPGVEVGCVTLVSGDGPLRPGEGPVRTGVTALLPRGRAGLADVSPGIGRPRARAQVMCRLPGRRVYRSSAMT